MRHLNRLGTGLFEPFDLHTCLFRPNHPHNMIFTRFYDVNLFFTGPTDHFFSRYGPQ